MDPTSPINAPDILSGYWVLALTLSERTGNSRPRRSQKLPPHEARRRFERWRSQKPFDKDEHLNTWLTRHSLSETELYDILVESTPNLKRRLSTPPPWVHWFAEAWTLRGQEPALQDWEMASGSSAFVGLLQPLINHACNYLRREVQALCDNSSYIPFQQDRIVELALPSLIRRLTVVIGRVMVLELHVARHNNLLQGRTNKERFASFLRLLKQSAYAEKIFNEYPTLVRLSSVVLFNWASAHVEFFRRLTSDWSSLCDCFGINPQNAQVKHLEGDTGDRHCEGRSVIIARFDSGIRIVYKPRPSSIHGHLSNLFSWLHQRGVPSLRLPRLLVREGYGWAEYVAHMPCSNVSELREFYRRQGVLLAILHALRAMDFHSENLIAAGVDPVLVDVESLFHVGSEVVLTEDAGSDLLAESVMRVGLLPHRQWLKHDGQGTDQSGIGGAAGQPALAQVAVWENSGTDEMHLERKRLTTPALPNRPTLVTGECVDPHDYTNYIVQGFADAYRVITYHKTDLLSPEGPLKQFAKDEVRRVPRPTLVYSMILSESHHPDLMRNALERDHFFDQLWLPVETWLDGTADKLTQLIPFEKEDLWSEDIPYFLTRVDSRDLWSSHGMRIADFFQNTGLAEVQRRLASFSNGDLLRQTWLIRASMATLTDKRTQLEPNIVDDEAPFVPIQNSKLIETAVQIGERLKALAFEDGRSLGWIDMATVDGRFWTMVTDDLNLYSGLPGIILYFAYLGQITGNECYSRLAERALTRVRVVLNQKGGQAETLGAFEGTAGILYMLTHLAKLWGQSALVQEAGELIHKVSVQAADDSSFDVMSGSAGAIAVLLGFYQTFESDAAIQAACLLGRRLVQAAQPQNGKGLAWIGKINPEHPLTGFSHGAAGIAWALGKLYEITGEDSLLQTTLGGLAFERSVYSEERGWPDFRGIRAGSTHDDLPYLVAWCHGAVGIGLSRLDLIPCLGLAAVEDELEAALRITLKAGFGGSHCLCHGDLGNLEFLLQIQERFPDLNLSTKFKCLMSSIFDDGSQRGWRCDSPSFVERPGLLTGLSGIGYALLRLATPEFLPSLLLLNPPVRPAKKESSRQR